MRLQIIRAELWQNPVYQQERRRVWRQLRKSALLLLIVLMLALLAVVVVWGAGQGSGSWGRLWEIPFLTIAHLPSLVQQIGSNVNLLMGMAVLLLYLLILGGMAVHAPTLYWIFWRGPEMKTLESDLRLSLVSSRDFLKGLFWARQIPLLIAYGGIALFLTLGAMLNHAWEYSLMIFLTPVDFVLWSLVAAYLSRKTWIPRPVGLTLVFAASLAFHPFPWCMAQCTVMIGSFVYKATDFVTGFPGLLVVYGAKGVVALVIYRMLQRDVAMKWHEDRDSSRSLSRAKSTKTQVIDDQ